MNVPTLPIVPEGAEDRSLQGAMLKLTQIPLHNLAVHKVGVGFVAGVKILVDR
jgi:hypothetical protein